MTEVHLANRGSPAQVQHITSTHCEISHVQARQMMNSKPKHRREKNSFSQKSTPGTAAGGVQTQHGKMARIEIIKLNLCH